MIKLEVPEKGGFRMGSPSSEEGRASSEDPWHWVRLDYRLAVGVHEITFGEWDHCVEMGGCGGRFPDEPGGQGPRESLPVVDVTWEEAQSYIAWLRTTTGRDYRLPSEAEWEYAARAGTDTPYSFGSSITSEDANFGEANREGIVPVGSYQANGFGLRHMHGNASEWVEDCWHEDYKGAPQDGSAWKIPESAERVVRGGAWNSEAKDVRSASRDKAAATSRSLDTGFRVVLALDGQ